MCRDAPHLALLCAGAAQCPRGTRGGVAPFPPSLTLFAPILFPRAQSVFLPRRRAWWESRLAGGPRTAQARGRPVNVVGQGAERSPVRQKNGLRAGKKDGLQSRRARLRSRPTSREGDNSSPFACAPVGNYRPRSKQGAASRYDKKARPSMAAPPSAL